MFTRLRKIFAVQESGLLLVVLALGILFAVEGGSVERPVFRAAPDGTYERVMTTNAAGEEVPLTVDKNRFLNANNLVQLAKDTSFIGIMAVGMAIVIISGGIDLSVGAIYALSAVLAAKVLHEYGPSGSHPDSPWLGVFLGALTCVGTGLLCGLVNGGLIVALRMHPFIITLGTMAIFRGVAFKACGGQSIGTFPGQLQQIVKYDFGDELYLVPLGVMLVVTIAGWVYLSRLAAGRRVYAVGGNELAAQYSGIRVQGVKLGVYLWSGATAGLAALLALGYYGSGTSGDGQGYELSVIAAAVVGGASLTGGRGSALGAMLGALIIQMINTGIIILDIDQNNSLIITGAVVILAVALDTFNTRLAQRRLAQRAG